ncbi:MAG: hypothetical protein ACE149_04350 [Armatimonadota bacterium]
MKYDKKDRAKIVVLAAILIVLWVVIGVRFALLSRQHKAKLATAEAAATERAAAALRAQSATPAGQKPLSPALRLAALVAPVQPPKGDPFHPIIPPRNVVARRQSAPAVRTADEPQEPAPALPPLAGSGERGGDNLQLTGIIAGTPSTAVLRLGEDHFVVREGDVLDTTLRVQKISKTTVTLRDGKTAYTLRLGG